MRIICIADKIGRVQYSRMKLLENYMTFDKFHTASLDENIKWNNYDLAYYTHFSIFKKKPCPENMIKLASITSHKCLSDKNNTIKELSKFNGISVNNTILFKEFKDKGFDLHYTPNGVDTKFFYPVLRNRSNPVTIGWVGNKDRSIKRYDLAKKVESKFDPKLVRFKFISPSKSDAIKDLLTPKQMVRFYQDIDYLLITSKAEGTPNPALEAMACGTPCITTKVGNTIEIIEDNINGYYWNDIPEDLCTSVYNRINDVISKKLYYLIREEARRSIESWDWIHQSKAWVNFFESYDRIKRKD